MITAALAAAFSIIFFTSGSGDAGISGYEGQTVYHKCVSANCSNVQQMSKTEYFQTIKDKYNNEEKPLKCEKCGNPAIRALKCEKCGNIFIRGSVRNDYADRCPKCKFSPSQAGN